MQGYDRDVLRFLWEDNPFDATSKLKVLRLTRVCFRLVSSMFHLEATIDHHLNRCLEDYPDINPDTICKRFAKWNREVERCVRALHSIFVNIQESKYESSKMEKQFKRVYDVH